MGNNLGNGAVAQDTDDEDLNLDEVEDSVGAIHEQSAPSSRVDSQARKRVSRYPFIPQRAPAKSKVLSLLRRRECGQLPRSERADLHILSDKLRSTVDKNSFKMMRMVTWFRNIANGAEKLTSDHQRELSKLSSFVEIFSHGDVTKEAAQTASEFVRLGGLESVFDFLRWIRSFLFDESLRGLDKLPARRRRELTEKRHHMFEMAGSVLISIRELLHCIGDIKPANDWYLSDEGLVIPLTFLAIPNLANAACYAADELLARASRVLAVSTLEDLGLDLPKLLLRLSPKDFAAASHLLAFLVFDSSNQDPVNPMDARRMLRRAKDTGTHACEKAILDPNGGFRDLEFEAQGPEMVVKQPMSISAAIDDNHAAVITAAEGLILHRLLVLLGAPPAPVRFERAARLVQQLQQGGDPHQILGNALLDPELLETLQNLAGGGMLDAEIDDQEIIDTDDENDAQVVRGRLSVVEWDASTQSVQLPSHVRDMSLEGAPSEGDSGACTVGDLVDLMMTVSTESRYRNDIIDTSEDAEYVPLHPMRPSVRNDGAMDVTPTSDSRLGRWKNGCRLLETDGPANRRYIGMKISAESSNRWSQLEQLVKPYVQQTAQAASSCITVPDKLAFGLFDVPRLIYDFHSEPRMCLATVDSTVPATESAAAVIHHPSAGPKDIFSEADTVTLPLPREKRVGSAVRFSSNRTPSGAAPREPSPAIDRKTAMVLTQVAAHKTEIAFVLAAHMSGAKRRQIQDFLTAHGVLPLLASLFAKTNWLYDPGSNPPPRIHGPTCQCRPETAGTIQIMRLLYCCIDRDADSAVQRWLPRRRIMMQAEIRHAFVDYAKPQVYSLDAFMPDALWALQHLAKIDNALNVARCTAPNVNDAGFADEAAVLAQLLRPALCRPWGWLSPSGEFVKDFTAGAKFHVAWKAGCNPAVGSDDTCIRLRLSDPALAGRNAQCIKAFSVDDIDSGEEVSYIPLRPRPMLTPESQLLVDHVCMHTAETDDASMALAKAMSKNDVGPWSPELIERPRGVISLLLQALVLSAENSPYRGWLSSCVESFLRACPEPVRRWVCAHGLVRYLVNVLLKEYAGPAIRQSHLIADANDVAKQRKLQETKDASDAAATNPSRRSLHYNSTADGSREPYDSEEDADSEDSEGQCNEEELAAKYSLQSMFDVLGECMRSNAFGLRELFAFDAQWTAANVSAYAHAKHPETAVAGEAWHAGGWGPGMNELMAGTSLLRLAFDRLLDSNVFFRNLILAEDWAHGLCAAATGVSGCMQPTLSDESLWSTHRWSWGVLCAQSKQMLGLHAKPRPWYEHCDASILESPAICMIREFRIPLTYQLMACVTLNTLTQENLCCINSGLCNFVIAHRHGALPAFVHELREYDRGFRAWVKLTKERAADLDVSLMGFSAARTPPPVVLPSLQDGLSGAVPQEPTMTAPSRSPAVERCTADSGVLDSFAKLLLYWIEYYSVRERDRRSLRISYGYGYEEWRVVVRALLGLDPLKPSTEAIIEVESIGAHALYPTVAATVAPRIRHEAAEEAALAGKCVDSWKHCPWSEGYWEACRMLP